MRDPKSFVIALGCIPIPTPYCSRMAQQKVQRIRAREAATLRAESLRASLPLGQYLNLLHEAVTTGEIPVLTKDCKPTGISTPIAATERLRLLQYLIDKAMPAAAHPNSVAPEHASQHLDDLTPDQVRRLTLSELQRVLTTTPTTPTTTTSTTPTTTDE